MDLGLAGRTAVVTGASKRTGLAKQPMAGVPAGRFGTPDEVAAPVVMAAGDRAGNVTGAGLVIDGGMVATL
jgi:NAD(P)-dependent dehydrogenase (short-subunit alcohol dehydrogenase family)